VVSFILGLFFFFFFFLDRRFDGGAFFGYPFRFLFFISLEEVFLFFCALAMVLGRVPGKKKPLFICRSENSRWWCFYSFLTFDFIAMYVIKTI